MKFCSISGYFYNGTSKQPSETESSHITLHPDGQVNFRMKRSKKDLEKAIKTICEIINQLFHIVFEISLIK